MSANVETMMYVREKPWHGLGVMVETAPDSKSAIHLAGLDWRVEKKDMYLPNGIIIPDYKANVRDSDGAILGVVSDKYKIVQNDEAFAFTDSLISGDVKYETAGSLKGGKTVWMLAKMPTTEILGDETEQYLCFSNTHDGTGAVRVFMTPIRVVCNNTLNLALSTAQRCWSMKHMGDIEAKIEEAQDCLRLSNKYMDGLKEYADNLSKKTVTDEALRDILNDIFPINDDMSEREKNGVAKLKDEFMICYFMPDIDKFRGTAWGVVNAMTDMVAHSQPRRNTKNYQENNWGRIMNGHTLVDNIVSAVNAI